MESMGSMYSGLTALEDRRDRGRSRSEDRREERRYNNRDSPSPPRNGVQGSRGYEFHRIDNLQMGAVKVRVGPTFLKINPQNYK